MKWTLESVLHLVIIQPGDNRKQLLPLLKNKGPPWGQFQWGRSELIGAQYLEMLLYVTTLWELCKVKEEFKFILAAFKRPKRRLLVKRNLSLVGNTDSFVTWTLMVRQPWDNLVDNATNFRGWSSWKPSVLMRNQMSARYHHRADVLWILWTIKLGFNLAHPTLVKFFLLVLKRLLSMSVTLHISSNLIHRAH